MEVGNQHVSDYREQRAIPAARIMQIPAKSPQNPVVSALRVLVLSSAEVQPAFYHLPRRVIVPTERQHRQEIVRYGRMLHERGFVAAMDGNLSVRLKNDRILVTPTCLSKGAMQPADMVVVDLDGHRVSGRRNVTSEIGMHLLIYRLRPDVQAIVHAHPPTATGFAAAGVALTEPLVCEVVMGLGCIPLARYGTPGTSELTQTLEPYVPNYDAILMSNHGVVTYGDTLEHAYMKMETVEHFAQIALVTHLLGRQQPLQAVEIEKLLLARTKYFGPKIAASMPQAPQEVS
ncbi:MAG: class II aldolase/adducin family protein [Terriglobales bacterium]